MFKEPKYTQDLIRLEALYENWSKDVEKLNQVVQQADLKAFGKSNEKKNNC